MSMKNVSISYEFYTIFIKIRKKFVWNSYKIETFFIDIVLSYKLHTNDVDWVHEIYMP